MEKTVWTRHELLAAGKSSASITRAVRAEKIRRLCRGIYALRDPDPLEVLKAVTAARPEAVVDGATAIALHQYTTPNLPICLRVSSVVHGTGTPAILHLRRSRRSAQCEIEGYRVVLLADAIGTCLEEGSVPESRLRLVAEKEFGSYRGNLRLDGELAALATSSKSRLAEFLQNCSTGTDSALERAFVDKLRRHGFVTTQNFKVGGYKWDVCLRELGVLIDVDSRRFHAGEHNAAFVLDRWKTNHAQVAGWTALRVSGDCIQFHAVEVLGLLEKIREFRGRNPTARLAGIVESPVWEWHMEIRPL
ncbi:type IV toxin-antitoxin system AbiEi family antitoxin domain-containing protein [Corynebacterium pacaense]|uniref:type IV toxin-antitoxin system AbiEi family antitoxin domain-containing protein n=1 Tax=Corynebacterium pacaense TaxID=1816684 RepID=UPI0009BC5FAC|nr:type IV toxin-antitoxin system AbiEi family antitoxin domain-containing protein [Corynebacterium pacaense]